MENRLLVVSNRLPVTLKREGEQWKIERSAGGLATAMNPILNRTGGLWIGWAGDSVPDPGAAGGNILAQLGQEHCVAINIPPEVAEQSYGGYSNQVLWPLFHYFASDIRFESEGWSAYVEANRTFRDAVLEHYKPGDLIWVHDYHLMLLPGLLREALPDAAIGFFLHIPFPSPDIFSILPRRDELLTGLLGADLVAFQTHVHLQQFRASLLRVIGRESRINEVDVGARTTRLEALPIGIAPEEYTELLHDDRTAAQYNDLKARYRGLKVILAVDRLDYTKGMPERLRAYRRLLESDAGLRQKVVLIQIAVPTREGIDTYEDLRSEVNRLIGEINGKAGSSDWTPIVYVNRAIERQELVALYRLADVAWVSPLRDGMNLVAKEYAACKPEGDGVLVLSEFAGAAAEMGEALLVNPYDEESTALAVSRALELDEDERRKRMLALHRRVLRNNVFAWSETFLSHLGEAVLARAARVGDSSPRPLPVSEAVDAYRAAGRRMLLLDYDGTLVGFASVPERANPPESLLRDLRALAAEPSNLVALVSGRASHDLARWFGDVRGLWLFAEHGVEVRNPQQNAWAPHRPIQTEDWKGKVLPILEHFVDRTPGSSVEEKNYSLVWHYRMAEPEFGAWLANELVAMLEGMLAETELRAVRGDKIVEVRPNWANKGQVIDYLSSVEPSADFRLAVGDDRTDEDLFTRADPSWWTVKVGDAPSAARFLVPSVDAVRALLARFIAAPGTSGRPVTSPAP